MKTMCMPAEHMTPVTVNRANRAVSVAGKSETMLAWAGVQKSDHKDHRRTPTFPAAPAGSRVDVAEVHVSAANAEALAMIQERNKQTLKVAHAADELQQHRLARSEAEEQSKHLKELTAVVTAKDRTDFEDVVEDLKTSESLTHLQKMDAVAEAATAAEEEGVADMAKFAEMDEGTPAEQQEAFSQAVLALGEAGMDKLVWNAKEQSDADRMARKI